jgi:hypothetical protein
MHAHIAVSQVIGKDEEDVWLCGGTCDQGFGTWFSGASCPAETSEKQAGYQDGEVGFHDFYFDVRGYAQEEAGGGNQGDGMC